MLVVISYLATVSPSFIVLLSPSQQHTLGSIAVLLLGSLKCAMTCGYTHDYHLTCIDHGPCIDTQTQTHTHGRYLQGAVPCTTANSPSSPRPSMQTVMVVTSEIFGGKFPEIYSNLSGNFRKFVNYPCQISCCQVQHCKVVL